MTYKKLIILYIVVLAMASSIIFISNKNNTKQTQYKINVRQELKIQSDIAITKNEDKESKISKVNRIMIIIIFIFCIIFWIIFLCFRRENRRKFYR